MEVYVDVKNLSFHRGDRAIYEDITLQIPKGKITAVMGPSGVGKTTLLRLIGGQVEASSGSITVAGLDVAQASRKELFEARRKMGMLFQSGALFSDMSVYENVALPLQEHTDFDEAMIRDIVLMKLQSVGLRGAAYLMPAELSGGMARRAALARAIALDPDLVMYDEPFAGQDPISKGVLVELIKRLNRAANITSVLVSHDVEESLSIADHVCLLSAGRVILAGTPDEVRQSSDPRVVQFLQGQADGPVGFHYPAPNYEAQLLEA
ncbi:ATP-binding cassette domain-containing protein [Marinomonas communis]|jgi:phospholipid/cholesterol/gamma-HCH transport system ATP-binding protein|uniref:Phospholipid/cholesterol/gamma-HCH transport system ATP-binding protein n=1 Tax=Marinomonas communis TaxID=28254 RepID=A0A4R6XHP5_9GAMM|nr:ATP-binding cassette domain-containing protein [Marinomonas communis]MCC4275743.1 ATP-binding cassette domain-containing protein [Marinomonas communis]MEC8081498.1 ATP-binding cassette domain-containing protein [Pseudomonadota bacterium]TDR15398.1 phospholipid/cholesterol/gamma-HCH transport system ATP-binding protein [Marinomonas communis]